MISFVHFNLQLSISVLQVQEKMYKYLSCVLDTFGIPVSQQQQIFSLNIVDDVFKGEKKPLR